MMSRDKDPLLPGLSKTGRFLLIIHGGAGTMQREGSTPEQRALYTNSLESALTAGYEVLSKGGEAMDAAVAAVTVMEDCPLFNCAKGAVFNVTGKNELEASIMLSKPPAAHPEIPANRRGIGLTLLTRAKNPSRVVRALYLAPDVAPHTFLSGSTAEHIAESLGEHLVDPSYFFTKTRWIEHRRGLGLPEHLPPDQDVATDEPNMPMDQMPTGTVGAVALDIRGCVAALTSTGGRTNKLVGRIGDTPHMGAGFWAEEWEEKAWWRKAYCKIFRRPATKAVGVSGTGNGDYFIRYNIAASIVNCIKSQKQSLLRAAQRVILDLGRNEGEGGVIALDSNGNYCFAQNCTGMYRGVIKEDGVPKTAIFNDEILS